MPESENQAAPGEHPLAFRHSRPMRWWQVAIHLVPVLVFMTAIVCISGPGARSGRAATQRAVGSFLSKDKGIHFAVFALLTLAAAWALASLVRRRWLVIVLAGAWSLAFGAVDEVHQIWVPGRGASVVDWAWDAGGAAAACLLMGMAIVAVRILGRKTDSPPAS